MVQRPDGVRNHGATTDPWIRSRSGRFPSPLTGLRLASAAGALLLAACASDPAPRSAAISPSLHPPSGAASSPAARADLVFRALGLVGTPYRSAGSDPRAGFDCSGFVLYVYRDSLGLTLPRSTRAQFDMPAAQVRRERLANGDLVFFDTSGRGISHVGIYVGEGRFVHAPNHGGRVRLDRIDDRYWRERYRGARRVLR